MWSVQDLSREKEISKLDLACCVFEDDVFVENCWREVKEGTRFLTYRKSVFSALVRNMRNIKSVIEQNIQIFKKKNQK